MGMPFCTTHTFSLPRGLHARHPARRRSRVTNATAAGNGAAQVPAAIRRPKPARAAPAVAERRRCGRSCPGAWLFSPTGRGGAGQSGLAASAEIVLNPGFELGSVLTVHTVAAAMTRGGDVLLMDADVLYHERIMAAFAAGQRPVNRMLMDREFEAGDEPAKLCVRDGVASGLRKQG